MKYRSLFFEFKLFFAVFLEFEFVECFGEFCFEEVVVLCFFEEVFEDFLFSVGVLDFFSEEEDVDFVVGNNAQKNKNNKCEDECACVSFDEARHVLWDTLMNVLSRDVSSWICSMRAVACSMSEGISSSCSWLNLF